MFASRRSFLISAGSALTAAFLKEARELALDTESPLLVPPPHEKRTLFFEEVDDCWRLHLGEPEFEIPEPPRLIDSIRWLGTKLETQVQIDAYCTESGFTERELFDGMDGFEWESQWEHNFSSEARAFEFLETHDVVPNGHTGRREGKIVFEAYPNPMSCARWVEVHDPLSLSLLQARLNELQLNTAIKAWEG